MQPGSWPPCKTLHTREPCRLEYRLPGAPGHEERWFEALVTAIVQDGVAVQMLGVCRDVTERLRVNREVRVRARQQETLARLGERALTESDLQKFFDEVVATVGEILDVDWSRSSSCFRATPSSCSGRHRMAAGHGREHPRLDRPRYAGRLHARLRPSGDLEDLASETRFSGSALLHDHGVVSGLTAPIAGSRRPRLWRARRAHHERRKFHDYDVSFLAAVANVVAGAIQRRQLDQRHELMIRELRHRSGNLFSQLLALFSQTAKNSRSVAELVAKYEARVLALANAHRLITEGGWKSTSLNELLNTLLAPFLDRISFHGPERLSRARSDLRPEHGGARARDQRRQARQPFHPAGRVDCTWSITRTQQGLTLVLDWKESRTALRPGATGAPASAPA